MMRAASLCPPRDLTTRDGIWVVSHRTVLCCAAKLIAYLEQCTNAASPEGEAEDARAARLARLAEGGGGAGSDGGDKFDDNSLLDLLRVLRASALPPTPSPPPATASFGRAGGRP
jgi:hypothetical protein